MARHRDRVGMKSLRSPRTRLHRLCLTVLVWLAVPGAAGVTRAVVQDEMNTDRHFGGNLLITDTIPMLPELFPVTVLAFLLPLVAYRRRDAMLYLIPFYGWIFFAKAAWRLADLPPTTCSTMNTGDRHDSLVEAIRSLDADVLAVQELLALSNTPVFFFSWSRFG